MVETPGYFMCEREKGGNGGVVGTEAIYSISTYVFAFYLLINIHSSIKIHHVNRAYFAQQIVRCYDQ